MIGALVSLRLMGTYASEPPFNRAGVSFIRRLKK